jgi:hypothetical protein
MQLVSLTKQILFFYRSLIQQLLLLLLLILLVIEQHLQLLSLYSVDGRWTEYESGSMEETYDWWKPKDSETTRPIAVLSTKNSTE